MLKNTLTKYQIIILTGVLLWIKSYLVYKISFDLKIENAVQELILLINPLSSVVFIMAFALFFSGRARNIATLILNLVASFVLFANMVYYRFFNDFITIPVLFQTSNMGDLGSSITSLIYPYDLLLFADLIFFAVFMKMRKLEAPKVSSKKIGIVFASSLIIFIVNVGIAETERPQLLTRSFDREMLIKNIGAYNYHAYDAIIQSKAKAQRALADGSEIADIENYVKADYKKPDPEMFGAAEGKNVVMVSMESIQNFVLDNDVEGNEITPFLNQLKEDKDTYYFPNFYHQTGQGKTSDSEFLLANSMYPLPSGAVFFTHSQNEYQASPETLKEKGYFTANLHANNKSFWNRDIMYNSLGYEKFYSLADYEVTPEQSIGWGLKDEFFFQQSVDHMKEMPEPYYTKFITLTNHFPFSLEKEDEFIPEWNSNDGTVNRYFTTVRYMDESVKMFFDSLKNEGMYEDTMFVLYGDHYGISENHNKAMGEYLGKEITPFESTQLQQVPLYIHIPGDGNGKVMDTVGGQVDLRPTIMHLLGIETKNSIQFGSDLFSKERQDFAVLRDGSFITKDHVYTDNTCYDKETGEPTEKSSCESFKEKAEKELDYSDRIIYGDLLRFFDPKTGQIKTDK
ncbi:LTA synthase family protein [Pseudalkalibacillus berkeleyi]|uniref:LTA synthase family protein n=1 Tax=Pseudalkalibacillus berkeleyi TaxID=1069813 RepID=A0ABS9H244_9BACL|nr:LTA synthase family protein [Pseudalkalibacillus berkeleyi]MCF6137900.1 LTA synthase family protein [Pseudalkalibacillus berkeleyi]